MRLLLDECVVRDLKKDLAEHEVSTVVEAGFGGLENGNYSAQPPVNMMFSSLSIATFHFNRTSARFKSH